MQGKVLGIPLVLLLLVVLVVTPLAVLDVKLSQQLEAVGNICSVKAIQPLPTASVSPTVTPSVSPVVKHSVFPAATSSGGVR